MWTQLVYLSKHSELAKRNCRCCWDYLRAVLLKQVNQRGNQRGLFVFPQAFNRRALHLGSLIHETVSE